jgi:large subunit ribosomal protein L18
VRKSVSGTPERPRLAVFRSLSHIYVQVIDDSSGRTLVAASDVEAGLRGQRNGKKKTQVAELVGEALARKAAEKGIKAVVFDRGGFRYHGRIKALAEAARKGGLSF